MQRSNHIRMCGCAGSKHVKVYFPAGALSASVLVSFSCLQESLRSRKEVLLTPLGERLEASGAERKCSCFVLGRSKKNPKTVFSSHRGQLGPQKTPGEGQNTAQNRFSLKMPKSLKLVHSTQDLNDFPVRKVPLWAPKWKPKRGPKRDLDAEGS